MEESRTASSQGILPPGEGQNGIERRDFLNEIAAVSLGVAALGSTAVTVRFLSPNVLFEPPASFRAGRPDEYPANSVTYIAEQEVYIVRMTEGFYAVSAICTHLGCITQWKPEQDLIACPCHGSRFSKTGALEHGPAPQPLPHFAIRLMPNGELQVNKLEIVPQGQALKA